MSGVWFLIDPHIFKHLYISSFHLCVVQENILPPSSAIFSLYEPKASPYVLRWLLQGFSCSLVQCSPLDGSSWIVIWSCSSEHWMACCHRDAVMLFDSARTQWIPIYGTSERQHHCSSHTPGHRRGFLSASEILCLVFFPCPGVYFCPIIHQSCVWIVVGGSMNCPLNEALCKPQSLFTSSLWCDPLH